MQYTAGQAATATGKNIATITRAIKSGKISAKKDSSGAWRIDPVELHRIFPLAAQDSQNPQMQSNARGLQELQTSNDGNGLQAELEDMRKQLHQAEQRAAVAEARAEERAVRIADMTEDRDRWRQQASNLLADLRPTPETSTTNITRPWWRRFFG